MAWGSGGWGSLAWGSTIPTFLSSGGGALPVTLLGIASGPLPGGTQVVLISDAMTMASCTPDLTDAVLDPGFWTATVSGSGAVVELPSASAISLSTGSASGSTAGVRTQAAEQRLDIEVQLQSVVRTPGSTAGFLRLHIDALNQFTMSIIDDTVRIQATVGGATVQDTTVVLPKTSAQMQLRFVRTAGRVIGFVGPDRIIDADWILGNAHIEVGVANTGTGGVVSRLTRYVRRPVVLFGLEPAVSVLDERIAVVPAASAPGLVDINIIGCTGTNANIPNGFEYILEPKIKAASLEVISDAVLTRRN